MENSQLTAQGRPRRPSPPPAAPRQRAGSCPPPPPRPRRTAAPGRTNSVEQGPRASRSAIKFSGTLVGTHPRKKQLPAFAKCSAARQALWGRAAHLRADVEPCVFICGAAAWLVNPYWQFNTIGRDRLAHRLPSHAINHAIAAKAAWTGQATAGCRCQVCLRHEKSAPRTLAACFW